MEEICLTVSLVGVVTTPEKTGKFTILYVQFCMCNGIFDVGCGIWDVLLIKVLMDRGASYFLNAIRQKVLRRPALGGTPQNDR
jgi:hypothetical protein